MGAFEELHRNRITGSLAIFVLGRLADLAPTTLALMHGSSFAGDGRSALRELAQAYDARFLAHS
jgi:hypothetical protein